MTDMKLTTGQVITLGDGRLACPIGEVYEACNGLLGDDLMTHQLVRAGEFLKPHVQEACPWVTDLPELDLDGVDDKETVVLAWVDEISAAHGETHEVPDLSDEWEKIDPLQELVDMRKS